VRCVFVSARARASQVLLPRDLRTASAQLSCLARVQASLEAMLSEGGMRCSSAAEVRDVAATALNAAAALNAADAPTQHGADADAEAAPVRPCVRGACAARGGALRYASQASVC
jgi:hypothetical protein